MDNRNFFVPLHFLQTLTAYPGIQFFSVPSCIVTFETIDTQSLIVTAESPRTHEVMREFGQKLAQRNISFEHDEASTKPLAYVENSNSENIADSQDTQIMREFKQKLILCNISLGHGEEDITKSQALSVSYVANSNFGNAEKITDSQDSLISTVGPTYQLNFGNLGSNEKSENFLKEVTIVPFPNIYFIEADSIDKALPQETLTNFIQKLMQPKISFEYTEDDTMQRNSSKVSQKDQVNNKKTDNEINNHNNKQNNLSSTSSLSSSAKTIKNRNKRLQSSIDNKTASHPWLASNLKGHTDEIHDIEFSSNGKYLASCAEADRKLPRKQRLLRNQIHRNSTSSEDMNSTSSEDINSSSSNEDTLATSSTKVTNKSKKPSRRGPRRRTKVQNSSIIPNVDNFDEKENDSQALSPRKQNLKKSTNKVDPKDLSHLIKISRAVIPPLKQHIKLNLQESEIFKFLSYYVIDRNLLRLYGYPVETAFHDGTVEIFKCCPSNYAQYKPSLTQDYPINKYDGLASYSKIAQPLSSDSGRGSESATPPSMESDESSEAGEEETATTFYTPDGNYQIFNNYGQSPAKPCSRCKRNFYVNEVGEYMTNENCYYHYGKMNRVYTSNSGYTTQYTCCGRDQNSTGCSYHPLHVWNGITFGMNGPFYEYIQTQINYDSEAELESKVYALDCEMCYTGFGLEATKVTVISSEGQLVYESIIRPKGEIIDYNTKFSGLTEKDFHAKNIKTLQQVQNDLLQFIKADTLLIGHALDNDLRVLKILHKNVIDTSISFPHQNGFPYRHSLKSLTKNYLNRDIQNDEKGHNSFEDSRACLELMLYRVRKDFRIVLEK